VPVEEHHVARRVHDATTVSLCLNCHVTITAQQQRYWPQNLTSGSYFILGWAALLMMARPFGRCEVIRERAGEAVREVHYVQTP
jgi:hypothetical protein